VIITLHEERFKKLVVEVADPQAAVELARAAFAGR